MTSKMAEWRDRGYVPDSDDEDEDSLGKSPKHNDLQHYVDQDTVDESNDHEDEVQTEIQPSEEVPVQSSAPQHPVSQPPGPTGAFAHVEIPALTTAKKLQAEIQRGLETCKEILEKPKLPLFLDDDDSPLSSLSASPAGTPPGSPKGRSSSQAPPEQPLPEPATIAVNIEPGTALDLNTEQDVMPMDLDFTPLPRPSRFLRPRTLLQINPYSLEYARYQQDCKRRGLMPVRLANFAAERAQANGEETRGSAAFPSSERASSPVRGSSPVSFTLNDAEEESQSPVRGIRHASSRLGSEDDLPDVADILQGRVQDYRTQRRKEKERPRKDGIERAQSKAKKAVFKHYDLPRKGTENEGASNRQNSVFDLPHSPPRSGSVSSDQLIIHPDDDVPVSQTTPRLLPTPILSSDRLSLKRKVIDVSSSSQEQHVSQDESNQHSSSDAEAEDSRGLVQIRRRIKGVLPASWLKLDAKQQQKKPTGQAQSLSPEKPAPLRGVAKHVASSRWQNTPSGTASKGLTFSSDAEGSSPSDKESRHPITEPALDFGFSDSDIDMADSDDDVVVEDVIDRMEPSMSRPFRPRKSGKKRQQRLDDDWRKEAISKPHRDQGMRAESFLPVQARPKKPSTKRVKRRHQAAQLSVLDAPGFRSANTRSQPSYLRVAARKRVSVRKAVPQNPTRKFFQLATREDTVDVNKGLDDWRSGRVTKARSRQEPVDANRPQTQRIQVSEQPPAQDDPTANDFSYALDQLKLSTAATISRLQGQETRNQRRVTSEGLSAVGSGGRQLLVQMFPSRSNQRTQIQADVPQWLGQVDLPSRFASWPASRRISPLRPHDSIPGFDHRAQRIRSGTPVQKPAITQLRKQVPSHRSRVPLFRSHDRDLPASASSHAMSLNEGHVAEDDIDQDRALAAWAVVHVALAREHQDRTAKVTSSWRDMVDAEETTEHVLSKLFSWQSLPKTYLLVESLWDGAGMDDDSPSVDTASQETLTLLSWLMDGRAASEGKPIFDEVLMAFIKSTFRSSTSCLAATLLILRILCSKFDSEGEPRAPSSIEPSYDGWSVLHPAINAFMSQYMITKGRGRAVYQDLGLSAVQFCHMAVRRWHWPSADSITKFWFKRYAENSMIELFVVPELHQLGLRSQQITLSPDTQPSDTDFDLFLKMSAALLENRAANIGLSGNAGRAASKIQSLVFSLSPNNSRELADEQNLKVEDLVSMANIYALYEFLNEFAPPGCQPRFSLVEQLINFPKCHWSVCEFALRAWSRYTHSAIDHGDHGNIYTLGLWMKTTITQMTTKIASVRLEVAELRSSGIQFAVHENTSRTCHHILELLQTWKGTVVRCTTAIECRALLSSGDIEDVVMICKDEGIDDDRLVLVICDLVQSYLDRAAGDAADDFRNDLHKQFRDVISTVLSSERHVSSDCMNALTSLWFSLARIAVSHKQRDWDDYLTVPSSWAFGLLADSQSSRQCKALFLSNLIRHDSINFELDREPFYAAWIEGLVQPEQNLQFENELTKSIIQHETDDLSLTHLRSIFQDVNGQLQLSLSDLKQHRLDVVKHIIRNLHSLQFDDDDSQDFLESPLNIHQGRNLLKLMTDTIKSQWRVLPTDQRQPYADFARAIVTQLRIYKYKGFEIDPWFVDPQQPEFPKEVPFAEQFLLPINAPCPVLQEHVIRVFTSVNLQAASTPIEPACVSDIASALSANTTSVLDAEGRLAVNTPLQFDFVRKVLSVCLKIIFKGPEFALFGRPVVTVLLQLVRDWHFRLDANAEETMRQMLLTAVELLSAIRTAFGSLDIRQLVTQGAAGKLVDQVLELAIACTRRVAMLEPMIEETEENMELAEKGFGSAVAIYECMTDQDGDRGYDSRRDRAEGGLIREKVLEVLDEALHGNRFVPAWRVGEPMASSWEAWLGGSEDEVTAAGVIERHQAVLQRFESVLIDEDLLDGGGV